MENKLVTERLAEYVKVSGKSVLSIEKAIGTRSTIQNAIDNHSNLGVNWITKILATNPDLSPEWLVTGNGAMLKSDVRGGDEFSVNEIIRLVQENEDALQKEPEFISLITRMAKQNMLLESITEDIKDLQRQVRELRSSK